MYGRTVRNSLMKDIGQETTVLRCGYAIRVGWDGVVEGNFIALIAEKFSLHTSRYITIIIIIAFIH